MPLATGVAAAAVAPPSALRTFDDVVRISFDRQIRSILAKNCFACHGPDSKARQADLRLDTYEDATAQRDNGGFALQAGRSELSLIIERVSSEDSAQRMPPPETKKRLTATEIELLRLWIDQGGEYEGHWSLIAPERPLPPKAKNDAWPRNPIDNFILARLDTNGLSPSNEAEGATLIRRASLDLTGIPPSLSEIDDFLADDSDNAYHRVLRRLLDSPRYGERLATEWLDAARYADTNGYHIDNERFMWPWRDWVIKSFNDNMPFDEFTIEQLAGDLLPSATDSQRIATGFNRNHMINFEGGAIPEEYLAEYVIDRVSTTATVWMGLTVGCARCHDHKFDPVSQKEFYQLVAFFNNISDKGLDGQKGNSAPFLKAPDPEKGFALAVLEKRIKRAEQALNGPMPAVDAAQAEWQAAEAARLSSLWTVLDPSQAVASGGATLSEQDDHSLLAEGESPDDVTYEVVTRTNLIGVTAIQLEALADERLPKGAAGRAENGNFVLTGLELEQAPAANPTAFEPVELAAAHADFSQAKFPVAYAIDDNKTSGWAVDGHNRPETRVAVFVPKRPLGFAGGTILRFRLRHESSFKNHAIGRLRLAVTTDSQTFETMSPSYLSDWQTIGPFTAESGKEAYQKAFEPETEINLEAAYRGGAFRWTPRPDFVDGKVHMLSGEISAMYLYRTIFAPSARTMKISLGSDDAIKVWLNDKVVLDRNVQRGVAPDQEKLTLDLAGGENRLLMKIVNYGGGFGFYFNRTKEQSGEPPLNIATILARKSCTEIETAAVRNYYRARHSPAWKKQNEAMLVLAGRHKMLDAKIPTTMVMAAPTEMRKTNLLTRGQYDQLGEEVTAAVPDCLPPLPDGAPPNRLGLARWLVDPSHPLTARVTVNRLWQMLFGTALVRTAEDFGTQGEWPSHPKLLDWLAVEFVESGWDVKHMLSLIMTSATYRQSSRISPRSWELDPQNRLVSRGARFRMPAEMVRDNALAISGLLVEHLGGPSVMPYQTPGLWKDVSYAPDKKSYSAQIYRQGSGSDLYRRSMYTFWKRSAPPPALSTFDAPNREVCTVRRARTNTPLQALVLMNAPTYVEAARALAQRAMLEGGDSPEQRVSFAFRTATARPPSDEEIATLLELFDLQKTEFEDQAMAAALLGVGESQYDESLDPSELAAWTTVTSIILNLDETITKN